MFFKEFLMVFIFPLLAKQKHAFFSSMDSCSFCFLKSLSSQSALHLAVWSPASWLPTTAPVPSSLLLSLGYFFSPVSSFWGLFLLFFFLNIPSGFFFSSYLSVSPNCFLKKVSEANFLIPLYVRKCVFPHMWSIVGIWSLALFFLVLISASDLRSVQAGVSIISLIIFFSVCLSAIPVNQMVKTLCWFPMSLSIFFSFSPFICLFPLL